MAYVDGAQCLLPFLPLGTPLLLEIHLHPPFLPPKFVSKLAADNLEADGEGASKVRGSLLATTMIDDWRLKICLPANWPGFIRPRESDGCVLAFAPSSPPVT